MSNASSVREASEPVPSGTGSLVLRVVAGWDPPKPEFSRIVSLRWGEQELEEFSGAIEVRGDRLAIGWDPNSMAMFESAHLREFPATATLEDGRTFDIDMLSFASNSRLDGHYWCMSTPGRATCLWLGRVLGLDDRGGFLTAGNLSIRRNFVDEDGTNWTKASNGHFRFSGAYTYYLFSRKLNESGDTEWFLAIDTGPAGVPLRKDVFADVLSLQFVLGRALYVDVLHGVHETDVVGLIGGRHGRDHSHRRYSQPTVPLDFSEACWAAHFFELLSDAARKRRELRLYIVQSFYLDGLASFHVEGRYLAMQVALESFAYWIQQTGDEPDMSLVNKGKWRAWLAQNESAIKELAAPGQENALFQKICSVPARKASSRVVESAFTLNSLALDPKMVATLEDRNRIVHTAVMHDERQEQLDAYLEPIAVVRTMLVALVARVVGYRGAILGWTREKGRPYDPVEDTWWAVDAASTAAASRRFIIDQELGGDPATRDA